MDKQFKEWWENASKTLKCDQYDAYEIWQQAQKVAVPEGFVLVKRNLTNAAAHAAKSVDGRLSAFKYSDVWDVMIEAQEQAND